MNREKSLVGPGGSACTRGVLRCFRVRTRVNVRALQMRDTRNDTIQLYRKPDRWRRELQKIVIALPPPPQPRGFTLLIGRSVFRRAHTCTERLWYRNVCVCVHVRATK